MPTRSTAFPPTRVVLLGDQSLYRLGLRRLLDSLAKITVEDDLPLTPTALQAALAQSADLWVVDLGSDTHERLEVIEHLVALDAPPLVVITERPCAHCVDALTRLGVRSIVSAWADRDELSQALVSARRDERYASPDLPAAEAATKKSSSPDLAHLSPRQRQILDFIADGFSVSEIARRLQISVKTVETHRARAQQILGFQNAKALMIHVVRKLQHRPLREGREKKQVRHSPTSDPSRRR